MAPRCSLYRPAPWQHSSCRPRALPRGAPQGADTVIYERLDPAYKPNEAMKESTTRHMEEFGSAGLRTLCLSYTEVDRDWYNTVWSPQWVEAKTSLQDRDAKVGGGQ